MEPLKSLTRRRGSWLGIAPGACASLLCIAPQAQADNPTFRDFPLVIYCEYSGITNAYYFSQLSGGTAIYLTPDRQAGTITIDGVAQKIGGASSGSCRDKTLSELRQDGQVVDLPR